MKGIIFTEFMDLVEQTFGLDILDKVLDDAKDEGIYTSVGSYDHRDLVKLIIHLSKTTNISPEQLQEVFGEAVFLNLLNTVLPDIQLRESDSCFQFIRHVEEYIHVEVKKLYPDAKPPCFKFISENETQLVMEYASARCMSHVCLGLIKGCAKHFNQKVDVQLDPVTQDGSQVQFTITLIN
ncbi:heme NO-binding domain-containing protein [Vibrio sp. SS-MA-C1-2]|uniref:heme NO-binding domain-containing protein n=1 Tax=Vibrio sp. SS-MA-C1-2 TaxID=2908646 RepID=UPI001F306537|nr:heme NO-binding domain-containing protein [Vibrio sp. SS-MA-C1-2]UJF20024.1 heme NO-binding domain-containing protein [Vibrio sp. SS-MA-C1-2]